MQQKGNKLRTLVKYTLRTLGSILGLALIYLFCSWLFSIIPVNNNPSKDGNISIYILTNGVHTDIVVPIKNEYMDWTKDVKTEHTLAKDSLYKYIGMGWGNKAFYMEIPTWSDLTIPIALKAATGMSPSAMHTTFYYTPIENDDCIKINITQEQYIKLVDYIQKSFIRDALGNTIHIPTNANYGNTDCFYEAEGSYSLFFTCNTWANSALKACDQKACLWTPSTDGIFYHYR